MSNPIVLVHGLFGFGELPWGGIDVATYFRGIPKALQDQGYIVPGPPQLSPAGTIDQRAGELKNWLNDNQQVQGQQVHIIAHSMGGLDARYMISQLGMADRVLTLTTVGTPHHGSPVADAVVAGTNLDLTKFVKHLGIGGIDDLTTDSCRKFNENVVDAPNVRHFSIAGDFEPPRLLGKPVAVLGPSHDFIQDADGDNDRMVSVNSAKFSDRAADWHFLGTWDADHFRLINWGTNIVLSPAELADDTIVEKYLALAALVTKIGATP